MYIYILLYTEINIVNQLEFSNFFLSKIGIMVPIKKKIKKVDVVTERVCTIRTVIKEGAVNGMRQP